MPKNIVLLSDGTGNSSAKLLKTNVWRIYESLDLSDPSVQVACYDDGVGTSSFKPLQLLGGALGVGLKRNVLRLYRFLCEHYDPGDRIYAIGFSRGAFTIRVLVGLICSQGIVKTRPTSPLADAYPDGDADAAGDAARATPSSSQGAAVFGAELQRLSRWAYRGVRREFNQTGKLVDIARNLRDLLIRLFLERGKARYDKVRNHQVAEGDGIRFVGVWDTVDAYGLPVDELTDGINKWVWPLSAPDLSLSTKVRKACHVVAIDDERNTFHPVLWDEVDETQTAAHIDEERITQVWFAGMHSNVGGGYPDDALSYVSLKWMTREAAKCGMMFVPTLLAHQTSKADPFGRIYDSRSGLKAYYRYNPRRIEWLTNGQTHESGFGGRPKPSPTVTVGRPKIHESVFARIAAAPEAYAPIIFPPHYAIVREDGSILDGGSNPYEDAPSRALRVQAQERIWNYVWWRRGVYFAIVFTTLGFLLQPFLKPPAPLISDAERTFVSRALHVAKDYIPPIPEQWVNYYSLHPTIFLVYFFGLLALMQASQHLQARICNGMRQVWSQVIPPPGRDLDSLQRESTTLERMRLHPYYQGALAVLRRQLLPTGFGLLALLLVAVWTAGTVNRVLFEAANGVGQICKGSRKELVKLVNVNQTATFAFNTNEFCASSGIELEHGARYRMTIDADGMKDDSIEVTSPAGFSTFSDRLTKGQRAAFALALPFRRALAVDWYVPIARVGRFGYIQYPLKDRCNVFVARQTGELSLFVNDAVAPVGPGGNHVGWKTYYPNNDGSIDVAITRIDDGDDEAISCAAPAVSATPPS